VITPPNSSLPFGCPPTTGPNSGQVRVLIATKPVDFRKGMDGLAAIIEGELKLAPFSGVIYVFRAKRADRVKLLFWDGTGICLLTKRLEGASFRWPKIEDGTMRLSPAQLSALLEGLDWTRVHARRVAPPTATQ
jgi:transposase